MLAISRNEGMRSWASSETLRENVGTSRVQRSVSNCVIDIFRRRAQKGKKNGKNEKKNSCKTEWKHERNLSGRCWLLHHNAVLQCQCTCKHHHSDNGRTQDRLGPDQPVAYCGEKVCVAECVGASEPPVLGQELQPKLLSVDVRGDVGQQSQTRAKACGIHSVG
jgi:hypothetical protein